MTLYLTRTPLSGAATAFLTSGLLLGFLDVAGKVQPNPLLPSFPFFFILTV
jgi:hypothetical protein